MKENIIIDGNTIYELDPECMKHQGGWEESRREGKEPCSSEKKEGQGRMSAVGAANGWWIVLYLLMRKRTKK
ncbi:MAG: hypothetical protein Q4D60_04955 [Eubacteriales bacterium]|nr:hypothetical protein [Eubacteriales bacterium]